MENLESSVCCMKCTENLDIEDRPLLPLMSVFTVNTLKRWNLCFLFLSSSILRACPSNIKKKKMNTETWKVRPNGTQRLRFGYRSQHFADIVLFPFATLSARHFIPTHAGLVPIALPIASVLSKIIHVPPLLRVRSSPAHSLALSLTHSLAPSHL